MIARPDIPPSAAPDAAPLDPSFRGPSGPHASAKDGGRDFTHGPDCDCPVCRDRYRQGRSVESEDASALAAGRSLLILVAGALAVAAWVWVLS